MCKKEESMNKIISISAVVCVLGFLALLGYCGKLDNDIVLARNKSGIAEIETACSNISNQNWQQLIVCFQYYQSKGCK